MIDNQQVIAIEQTSPEVLSLDPVHETTVVAPVVQGKVVKINEATEELISAELGITILQAKYIVEQRREKIYNDFDDFSRRCNLPIRISNRVKDQLDYTSLQRPTGRVIDF